MSSVFKGMHLFTAFNVWLADPAAAEQLIQPFEMLDVGSEMIQEHHIKKNTQNLRQRRIFLIGSIFLRMLEAFAANTDRQKSLCPQAYDRAERLLQTHATVPEKRRSLRCLKRYRSEDQWDGGRRADMLDRYLGRKCHPPASVPRGVSLLALYEQITQPGIVVSSRNGQGKEMPALDIALGFGHNPGAF